jgi:hypothetical protein
MVHGLPFALQRIRKSERSGRSYITSRSSSPTSPIAVPSLMWNAPSSVQTSVLYGGLTPICNSLIAPSSHTEPRSVFAAEGVFCCGETTSSGGGDASPSSVCLLPPPNQARNSTTTTSKSGNKNGLFKTVPRCGPRGILARRPETKNGHKAEFYVSADDS